MTAPLPDEVLESAFPRPRFPDGFEPGARVRHVRVPAQLGTIQALATMGAALVMVDFDGAPRTMPVMAESLELAPQWVCEFDDRPDGGPKLVGPFDSKRAALDHGHDVAGRLGRGEVWSWNAALLAHPTGDR